MSANGRKTLVVFDMAVATDSPAGSCVLKEIAGLAASWNIVLFSCRSDLAEHPAVTWFRVPSPAYPVFLRYWAFRVLARLRFLSWRMRHGRGAIVQATEGQFAGAAVVYAHFCHQAYLDDAWRISTVSGPRRVARWINHASNALFEKRAFHRAAAIVVPSDGLAREIGRVYPRVAERIVTIPNPVDVARFAPEPGFERAPFRKALGLEPSHRVFAFVALGDFDRKGLGVAIEALASMEAGDRAGIRVLVVGGSEGEIEAFRTRAREHGVGDQLVFVGLKKDIRPYLWASDVFLLPSLYETFSLAVHQAAAAGLPGIACPGMHGVENVVADGVSGWLVARDPEAVRRAMLDAAAGSCDLPRMSRAAREAAQRFSEEVFVQRWRDFYAGLAAAGRDRN